MSFSIQLTTGRALHREPVTARSLDAARDVAIKLLRRRPSAREALVFDDGRLCAVLDRSSE